MRELESAPSGRMVQKAKLIGDDGAFAYFIDANIAAWSDRWRKLIKETPSKGEMSDKDYLVVLKEATAYHEKVVRLDTWFTFGLAFRAWEFDGNFYALDTPRVRLSASDEDVLAYAEAVAEEVFGWEGSDEWGDILGETEVAYVLIRSKMGQVKIIKSMEGEMANFTTTVSTMKSLTKI